MAALSGAVGCGSDDDGIVADGPTGPSGCEAGYDPCVPTYPPDVDCPEVGEPVEVTGSDPHGLDGYDNDGHGCESE